MPGTQKPALLWPHAHFWEDTGGPAPLQTPGQPAPLTLTPPLGPGRSRQEIQPLWWRSSTGEGMTLAGGDPGEEPGTECSLQTGFPRLVPDSTSPARLLPESSLPVTSIHMLPRQPKGMRRTAHCSAPVTGTLQPQAQALQRRFWAAVLPGSHRRLIVKQEDGRLGGGMKRIRSVTG